MTASTRLRSIRLILAFLAVSTSASLGAPISAEQAQTAAKTWIALAPQPLKAQIGPELAEVKSYSGSDNQVAYHVVYLKPSGFVILPADDLVEPVICFASDGIYDSSENTCLGALVSRDLSARVALARTIQPKGGEALPPDAAAATAKWARLLGTADPSEQGLSSVSDPRVDPLIQSRWRQTTACSLTCYNYYTPSSYPCGCVATAMAQLMRFYQLPTTGVGAPCFSIWVCGSGQSKCLRGGDGSGGPYDWASMPLVPDCSLTLAQREAIGALCHDAGVSVGMDYCSDGSGADTLQTATALKNVFGYSNAVKGANAGVNIPTANRIKMINPNLDAGYPVLLGITGGSGGHAIVADGYGYQSTTLYHHLNMGWAGSSDAWYNLPNIDSSPSFTTVYKCIYNVYVSGSGEIISGRVTNAAGMPIEGAAVSASRTSGGTFAATTNSRGIYALPKLPSNSTYTVSVTAPGCTFTSQTAGTGSSTDGNSTVGNVWALDFAGDCGDTFSISGTITSGGSGVAGVTVTPSPSGTPATTDGAGNYTIAGLIAGTYTVTPSKPGCTFTPPSVSGITVGPNQSGNNFTANCAASCNSVTIGTGTGTWTYPLHTFYHDSRTQVIYLASEVGSAGDITSLALDVTTIPGQTMNNWTIRVKHTSLSGYATPAFENTGWTVCYQGNEPAGATGWRTFTFTTPFAYDGTSNLLIDLSHNNTSYTTNGSCRVSTPGGTRSVYACSDSGYGDPLNWVGSTSPTVSGSTFVPNLQLTVCPSGCAAPPAPANPNPLDGATHVPVDANLTWSGEARLAGTGVASMNPRSAVDSLIARSGVLQAPIMLRTPNATGGEEGSGSASPVSITQPEQVASLHLTAETLAEGAALNVAICGPGDAKQNDVQAKLLATGQFASVAIINVVAVTPTLAELQAFDAVLIYSDFPDYQNPVSLGNVMADYVDAGGGVVSMMFEIAIGTSSVDGSMMQGRWESGGYFAIPRGGQLQGSSAASLGTIHVPGHPVLQGVASFHGGTSSYRTNGSDIAPGSIRVADWSDGRPLIVTKTIGGTPRVDLAFFPPSNSVGSNLWNASTDGARLMANALTYVAGGAQSCSTTYDVYLDTVSPPVTKIYSDLTAASCDPPGDLLSATKYYWKVVAKNSAGSTESDIWDFTTEGCPPPPAPANPTPASGGANVPVNTSLAWDSGVPSVLRSVVRQARAARIAPDGLKAGVRPGLSLEHVEAREQIELLVPEELSGTILFDGYHSHWKPSNLFSNLRTELQAVGFTVTESTAALDAATLSPISVLVIASPKVAYGSAELSAIDAFVASGGGLFLLGEADGYWLDRAALNQVSGPYGVQYLSAGLSGLITLGGLHPILANVAQVYEVYGCQMTGVPQVLGTLGGQQVLGVSSGPGRVVFYADCNTFDDQSSPSLYSHDHLQFAMNIFGWLDQGTSVCPVTYDVYLDTVNPPVTKLCSDLSAPPCDPPGDLLPATKYYWKVVAKNTAGSTDGDVWNFTTEGCPPPPAPTSPVPQDGAGNVPVDSTLAWNGVSLVARETVSNAPAVAAEQFDLATGEPYKPVTTTLPPASLVEGAGKAVLWDLTHGVYLNSQPSGDYSALVSALAGAGYSIQTTSAGVNNVNLSAYNVLVICVGSNWNSVYTPAEVAAIQAFVASGGGLLVMGENTNCPNGNINPVAQTFGVTCGVSSLSPYDLYIADLSSHPVFAGCSQVYYRAGGAVTATTPAELIARSGTLGVAAVASFGAGRVVVTGDDSFAMNAYLGLADNPKFAENIFDWLSQGGVSCAVTYDVYLDTTNPPVTKIYGDLAAPSCDPPGDLLPFTTYYWKVVAKNCCGSTDGPVWSFTTRPAAGPQILHIRQSNGAVRGGQANINPDGPASIQARMQGITSCTIEFSEDVQVQASDILVRDVANTQNLAAPTTFSYAPATHVLTLGWAPNTFVNRWVRIHVLDSVKSVAGGRALDGEIYATAGSPASGRALGGQIPSGDGVAGGAAMFVLGALQGDVDGNKVVNSFDRLIVNQNQGQSSDIPADVDGNGTINSFDRLKVNQNQGATLSALPLP